MNKTGIDWTKLTPEEREAYSKDKLRAKGVTYLVDEVMKLRRYKRNAKKSMRSMQKAYELHSLRCERGYEHLMKCAKAHENAIDRHHAALTDLCQSPISPNYQPLAPSAMNTAYMLIAATSLLTGAIAFLLY